MTGNGAGRGKNLKNPGHKQPTPALLEKLDSIFPGATIDESTYINQKTKCVIKHPEYGDWVVRLKDVFNGKSTRPKTISLFEFKRILLRIPNFQYRLIEETYRGVKAKACFINESGEEWWVEPTYIITRGTTGPLPTYTSQELEQIIQQTRPHVSIYHETYTNSYTKAKFRDSEFGDFWAVPSKMMKRGAHPKWSKNCPVTEEEFLNRLTNNLVSLVPGTYRSFASPATSISQTIYWGHWRVEAGPA